MNREDLKIKNIIELTDKMTEEDKISFYEACVYGDDKKRDFLSKNMDICIYLMLVTYLIKICLIV